MKKMILVAVLVVAGGLMSGCEDSKNEWEFQNLSSHTVTVTPDEGQDWTGFVLEVDRTNTIKLDEDTIFYNYAPSNLVRDNTSTSGKIIFLNK